MKHLLRSGLLVLTVALTACGFGIGSAPSSPVASSSSSSAVLEVSYTGTLEKADPATLQEGTHRLALIEGGYLYLQSDSLNLDDYAGDQVKITGTVRATIDGTAKIMQVSQVVSLSSPSSSSSSTGAVLPTETGSVSVSPPVPPLPTEFPIINSSHSSVASVPVVAPPPPPSSSSKSSSSTEQIFSSASSVSSSDVQVRATAMAKVSMSGANWTQKYCTSFVGFCFPIHKNWWFKSFGASATVLWHVELSSEAITNLGDGPISINFLSGSLPSGINDSDVKTVGGTVTGYRSWTGGRHFEISAPASLSEAVGFITRNLETYEPPQAP